MESWFASKVSLVSYISLKEVFVVIIIVLCLMLSGDLYSNSINVKIKNENATLKWVFGQEPVRTVKCYKIFTGNVTYIKRVKRLSRKPMRNITSHEYISMTKDCEKFITIRGYINDSLTPEERNFSIAYSILLYKDIFQAERLLRAIYRPQNVYCLHIDKNSDLYDKIAIGTIASCFDNVFLVRPLIDVNWGTFSVLEPELLCMKELVKYKKWKYFINLTGQEFPLKTNYELVKILKAYNGANDLEGTRKRANKDRWPNKTAPHNIVPTKGSVHIVVNRDFVEYIIYNKTAQDILEWVKKTSVPDETFFSTLNHNPHLGIRGSYKGIPETDKSMRKPFLARFKNWGNDMFNFPCKGKWVHGICILGIGDLPLLLKRPELFANKFYWNYQHYALDCLEELIFNRTRDEYLGKQRFYDIYYKMLGFVRNKVK